MPNRKLDFSQDRPTCQDEILNWRKNTENSMVTPGHREFWFDVVVVGAFSLFLFFKLLGL